MYYASAPYIHHCSEEHEAKKAKTEDSSVANGADASQQHSDPNAYYNQWGSYGVRTMLMNEFLTHRCMHFRLMDTKAGEGMAAIMDNRKCRPMQTKDCFIIWCECVTKKKSITPRVGSIIMWNPYFWGGVISLALSLSLFAAP